MNKRSALVENGVLRFEESLHLPDGRYSVEIKQFRDVRSLNQNAYLHAIFEKLSQETGHSAEDIKCILKIMFLSKIVEIGDAEYNVTRDTRYLNRAEMTTFIEAIRDWSASTLGYYIPSPDEQHFENWMNL